MKIDFHYQNDFRLKNASFYADWITRVVEEEGADVAKLEYVFCSDDYLLRINQQYLKHDTYTDIITFDYSNGDGISGDIFISTERVEENAVRYKVEYENELKRVMIHGVLHLLGYGDKSKSESEVMRRKENQKVKMFHVEH